MRRFRTSVSLSTLFAYLVVGVVAAQGKTVLCLQSDGSVGVEQKGSPCCEHRTDVCGADRAESVAMPRIATADLHAPCSYCTDIPLGYERTSITEAPRPKCSTLGAGFIASCAALCPLLPVESEAAGLRTPSTAPPLAEAPAFHLQPVVLLC
jgi:hypothetical protein